MRKKLQSRWQRIKQRRVAIIITIGIIVIAVALIIIGNQFGWSGFTGYTQVSTVHTLSGPAVGTVTRAEAIIPGKSLWDWLQLLVIPLGLAIIAFLFNRATTRTEQNIAAERYEQDKAIAAERYVQDKEIASRHYHQDQQITERRYEQDRSIALDKQREDLLQIYLDRMSELLLKEKLRSSASDAEVRKVARVRTITILFQLDARRIGYVFAFLLEAGLMSEEAGSSIVNLSGANLTKINFSQTDLSHVNLSGAKLSNANFSISRLLGTNLSGADLSEANFTGANLLQANLDGAMIMGANFRRAYLDTASFSSVIISGSDLSEADLSGANFSNSNFAPLDVKKFGAATATLNITTISGANLHGANFSRANLNEVNLKDATGITIEELKQQAKSLKGAIMPDGTIYP